MNMEFKRAELVELHDAAVAVHPVEFADALAGWRQYLEECEHYAVDGNSLSALAEALGWRTFPIVGVNNTEDGEEGAASLAEMDLPLIRRRREVLGDNTTSVAFEESNFIRELWARVDGANLLQLKLVIERNEDGQPMLYTQEVTYSGRFSVWWQSPEEGEPLDEEEYPPEPD